MKKPFEVLFDNRICDHCDNYSDYLEQSEEGEWLCPYCEQKHTCHECGAITDEATLTTDHICFDCLNLKKEDFDLEPVAKLMENAITKLNKLI